MNTAQEFRDYMQPFVHSEKEPHIQDLEIQVYSRDRLTVTVGYHSLIPSIMFVMNDQESGFCVYIATPEDDNGPNQNRLIFVWKWEDDFDVLIERCSACVNIQEIVADLRNFRKEEEV